MRLIRRRTLQQPESASFTYPYYVDSEGLRGLADELGIELPTRRERRRERRIKATAKGVGGEAASEETSELEGHIRLDELARLLLESPAYRQIVDALGQVPLLHERGILDAVLDQVQNMPPDSGNEEFRQRIQSAHEAERLRAIAAAKRQELQRVAAQNQLVILRGTFGGRVLENDEIRLRLTHLEPAEAVSDAADSPAAGELETVGAVEMPGEVGVEVVLPASEAFTDTGRERIRRSAPFYGRVIGHSASFEEQGGVLVFSAYAVWGMPRPDDLLPRPRPYEFLEDQ
jgi:hypothetical protein